MKNSYSVLFKISLIIGVLVSPLLPALGWAADILYIGDSHSTGCFGKEVDVALRTIKKSDTSATVVSQASCGSASSHWLKSNGHTSNCGARKCDDAGKCEFQTKGHTDSIVQLLGAAKPQVTVVALGSNMIKGKLDQVENEARSLIAKIKESGAECVWIGPPQAALFFSPQTKFDEFVKKLEMIVESEGCRFISSADKTSRENLNDSMGLHYSCNDAAAWAKKIVPVLKPLVEAGFVAPLPKPTDTAPATVSK